MERAFAQSRVAESVCAVTTAPVSWALERRQNKTGTVTNRLSALYSAGTSWHSAYRTLEEPENLKWTGILGVHSLKDAVLSNIEISK